MPSNTVGYLAVKINKDIGDKKSVEYNSALEGTVLKISINRQFITLHLIFKLKYLI